jgi:hypothetical protein
MQLQRKTNIVLSKNTEVVFHKLNIKKSFMLGQ